VREPVDVAPLIELRRLQPPGKTDAVARIVGHFLAETSERLARLQAAVSAADLLADIEAAFNRARPIFDRLMQGVWSTVKPVRYGSNLQVDSIQSPALSSLAALA